MKKAFLLIILIILAALFINRVEIKDFVYEFKKEEMPTEHSWQEKNIRVEKVDLVLDKENNSEEKSNIVAKKYNLTVPFTVQAPNANWELPYQEACEEASLLMVHYYYQQKELNPDLADKEINNLVDWQEEYFGFYKDTTIEQTAKIAEQYWGYETEIITNPTIDIIKQNINKGYPVIAPFYGRAIGNPYYSGEGPLYHMMVIKGYQDDHFITNDPGTKRGANYIYSTDHLMSVIHDWNDGDVQNGQAVILILKK